MKYDLPSFDVRLDLYSSPLLLSSWKSLTYSFPSLTYGLPSGDVQLALNDVRLALLDVQPALDHVQRTYKDVQPAFVNVQHAFVDVQPALMSRLRLVYCEVHSPWLSSNAFTNSKTHSKMKKKRNGKKRIRKEGAGPAEDSNSGGRHKQKEGPKQDESQRCVFYQHARDTTLHETSAVQNLTRPCQSMYFHQKR